MPGDDATGGKRLRRGQQGRRSFSGFHDGHCLQGDGFTWRVKRLRESAGEGGHAARRPGAAASSSASSRDPHSTSSIRRAGPLMRASSDADRLSRLASTEVRTSRTSSIGQDAGGASRSRTMSRKANARARPCSPAARRRTSMRPRPRRAGSARLLGEGPLPRLWKSGGLSGLERACRALFRRRTFRRFRDWRIIVGGMAAYGVNLPCRRSNSIRRCAETSPALTSEEDTT